MFNLAAGNRPSSSTNISCNPESIDKRHESRESEVMKRVTTRIFQITRRVSSAVLLPKLSLVNTRPRRTSAMDFTSVVSESVAHSKLQRLVRQLHVHAEIRFRSRNRSRQNEADVQENQQGIRGVISSSYSNRLNCIRQSARVQDLWSTQHPRALKIVDEADMQRKSREEKKVKISENVT